jgi:hypothetical protein
LKLMMMMMMIVVNSSILVDVSILKIVEIIKNH